MRIFHPHLYFVLCSLLLAALPLHGTTNDSILVRGIVSDAFSRESMADVEVSVSNGDGFLSATKSFTFRAQQRQFDRTYYEMKVPRAGRYIFTFMKDGYITKSITLEIPERKYMKRVTFWQASGVFLSRGNDYKLGEATVTASRIMMVEYGDTIVYNAAAFQLAEGSMLDALIAQLPGVKIEKGGRITINGEFVSSLLVNGKEFFRGDPKVALDNLPAYMVQNVKAYQREPDDAYIMGECTAADKKKDPWVLDVNLKRQYRQGWIANAELAGGTADRWLARLFGLRFTDHSRLALYGNANNTNTTHEPGSNGDWDDAQAASGDVTTRQGGAMLSVDDKKSKVKFDTSIRATHTDRHDLQHTASTNFLTDRNTYGRLSTDSRTENTDVKWNANLFVPLKRVAITFQPEMRYRYDTRQAWRRSALWDYEPREDYRGAALDSLFDGTTTWADLVNSTSDLTQGKTETWHWGGMLRLRFKSPLLGRSTTVYLLGSTDKTSQHDFSQYTLRTAGIAAPDYRNRYTDQPARSYSWTARLDYSLLMKFNFNATFNYQYNQSYTSDGRNLYRLDSLHGTWRLPTDDGGRRIGQLPSTRDSLLAATDWNNSYRTLLKTRKHSPTLTVNLMGKWGTLNLTLPLNIMQRSIRDFRSEDFSRRTSFSRRTVSFEPTVMYLSPKSLSVSYSRSMRPVSLATMLDVRDDSNPLYVYLGGRDLKDTWYNAFSTSYRLKNAKRNQMFSARGNLWWEEYSVGYARTYDAETGVTTVHPRNINGNWGGRASFSYEQGVGKSKRVTLGTDTKFVYERCVDFLNDYSLDVDDYAKSTVNNYESSEALRADYRKGELHAGLRLSATWNRAASSRPNFTSINAVDLSSGLVLTTPLVWGIHFATDFTVYARRSYELSAMNSTDFIWNASLTRSFLHSKNLILKLTAYDLLADRSATSYAVNAQGRTETWTNSLTRYFMIHFIYRLNIKPKK